MKGKVARILRRMNKVNKKEEQKYVRVKTGVARPTGSFDANGEPTFIEMVTIQRKYGARTNYIASKRLYREMGRE